MSISSETNLIIQSMNYQVRFLMNIDIMIPAIFPNLPSPWIVSWCHRYMYHIIHSQAILTATVQYLILQGYSANRSPRLRVIDLVLICPCCWSRFSSKLRLSPLDRRSIILWALAFIFIDPRSIKTFEDISSHSLPFQRIPGRMSPLNEYTLSYSSWSVCIL